MKLPDDATNLSPPKKELSGAFIINPVCGKEKLTKVEALDAANILVGMVLLYERSEST